MHMTGQTPQRAQRRELKTRGDQRLYGAVDEVREMRPSAGESLHGLGRNRSGRLAPGIDTEVVADLNLVAEQRSLRIVFQRRNMETGMLRQKLYDGSWNVSWPWESTEVGIALEQAQEPQSCLRRITRLPNPTKLIRRGSEKIPNDRFGKRLEELWIGQKREMRIGQRSPFKASHHRRRSHVGPSRRLPAHFAAEV